MFDPTTLTPDERKKLEDRFWSKVDRSGPDDCWLWKACMFAGYKPGSGGYGCFSLRHKLLGSHVVAYTLTHAPVAKGIFVLHSCDVRYPVGDITYRRCCNPAHLWAGTAAENSADMVAKGRQATGDRNGMRLHPQSRLTGSMHWSHVHPGRVMRGERHPSATINETTARVILANLAAGVPQRVLARRLGVTRSTVQGIARGRSWKHLGH